MPYELHTAVTYYIPISTLSYILQGYYGLRTNVEQGPPIDKCQTVPIK